MPTRCVPKRTWIEVFRSRTSQTVSIEIQTRTNPKNRKSRDFCRAVRYLRPVNAVESDVPPSFPADTVATRSTFRRLLASRTVSSTATDVVVSRLSSGSTVSGTLAWKHAKSVVTTYKSEEFSELLPIACRVRIFSCRSTIFPTFRITNIRKTFFEYFL